MHHSQPHNIRTLVSRITTLHGVIIVVSYEQPSGISLAEYFAREAETPPPPVR